MFLLAHQSDRRSPLEILLGILASQQNGHNRVDLPLPRNGQHALRHHDGVSSRQPPKLTVKGNWECLMDKAIPEVA